MLLGAWSLGLSYREFNGGCGGQELAPHFRNQVDNHSPVLNAKVRLKAVNGLKCAEQVVRGERVFLPAGLIERFRDSIGKSPIMLGLQGSI